MFDVTRRNATTYNDDPDEPDVIFGAVTVDAGRCIHDARTARRHTIAATERANK